ncbi:hypothetical protein [Lewinella sp. W8]|uniref:hypothetical protein n=1 Tax=Lewinella sp. W8 TaxID=2528208 RepID=UPI001067A4D1|nr:hypothetical protein [Lewinella sp. W8]MTB52624.1 hypothetical protein [Lewinella sp. W8]
MPLLHRFPLLFLVLLGTCATAPSCFAQTATTPAFPEDFEGKWGGTLEIYRPEGVVQSVPMELHILPVDDTTYTYTIIYGEDKVAGKRDYYIVRGPDGPHHWVCDEKNTILLDGYYLGNIYQSMFTVMGNYIISSVEHRGDHLVYAIHSGKEAPIRESGGKEHAGEEIPPVNSFLVSGFQRARLELIEE